MKNPTSIVLLSGGMDSTTLAAELVAECGADAVHALGIHYGQRHERELLAAKAVAEHLGIRYDVLDLSVLGGQITSALTTDAIAVPDGHYAEESMKATVVPNRNAIMLMTAVGVAASRGAKVVYTAVHAGDHHVYPDCRPEFIGLMDLAAQAGTEGLWDVGVRAPYVHISKTDIAIRGDLVGAPLHLSWSCYKGGAVHCGTCGTCTERREAFTDAGLADPTTYEVAA